MYKVMNGNAVEGLTWVGDYDDLVQAVAISIRANGWVLDGSKGYRIFCGKACRAMAFPGSVHKDTDTDDLIGG